MSRFDLVFSSELVEGADPKQVRRNLEALFKADAVAIDRLFTGKPVVIRKDLDEETARRYRAALQKAGALCQLRAREVAADAPSAGLGAPEILPPGSLLTRAVTIEAPQFDLAAYTIAQPGVTLVEGQVGGVAVTPPTAVDADLAPVGDDLDDSPPPPAAPLPDISGITLAPPGTAVLSEHESRRPLPPPPDPADLALVPLPPPSGKQG